MSNEFKDWIKDATDAEVLTAYQRCEDNGWHLEATFYLTELNNRKCKES